MSAELFAEDIINPVLFLVALVGIGYLCISAVLSWYQASKAEQQVEHVTEEYPLHKFWLDLCNYSGCDFTEAEARGIYTAWQRCVVLREEVKQ